MCCHGERPYLKGVHMPELDDSSLLFPFLYSFHSVFILYTFVFTQCTPKLFVCVLVIEHSAKTSTREPAPTARKVVGEAGSGFRTLSITSLAKPEGCANRLIGKELAVL